MNENQLKNQSNNERNKSESMKQIEEMTNTTYDGSMPYKVLADHIRALTFAISDGAIFENVGRGYILRRLLRRSVRYGRKLGLNGTFMYKLVDSVVSNMSRVYPYLLNTKDEVKKIIKQEMQLMQNRFILLTSEYTHN